MKQDDINLIEKSDGWYVVVPTLAGIASAGPMSKAKAEQIYKQVRKETAEAIDSIKASSYSVGTA